MDLTVVAYAGYVITAIVVAVLAIRILYRDSKDRAEEQEQKQDDAAKLAAISAKAHRHTVREREKSRAAFDNLPPVIDVTEEEHGSWFDAALAKRARDEAVSRALDSALDDVVIRG